MKKYRTRQHRMRVSDIRLEIGLSLVNSQFRNNVTFQRTYQDLLAEDDRLWTSRRTWWKISPASYLRVLRIITRRFEETVNDL